MPSTSCVVPLDTKWVEKSARRMQWQQQAGTASPALQPSNSWGLYPLGDESLLAAPGRKVNISSSSGAPSPLGQWCSLFRWAISIYRRKHRSTMPGQHCGDLTNLNYISWVLSLEATSTACVKQTLPTSMSRCVLCAGSRKDARPMLSPSWLRFQVQPGFATPWPPSAWGILPSLLCSRENHVQALCPPLDRCVEGWLATCLYPINDTWFGSFSLYFPHQVGC